MAGDWIKLQKDTFDKPEVLAIATRMDIDPDAVVGKLCRIWAWFDTHTTHGNASCVTFSFVDRYVGVTGFAEQVALVGWLAQDGHDLRLPNFDYHNGETSKTRALGKNRAEKARSNARSNAPCVTKSLPEKRREEKSNSKEPKGSYIRASKKCPDSFVVTDELSEWAKTDCPLINVASETAAFKDYTFSSAKTDWIGTWRNWMRKANTFASEKQKPKTGAPKVYHALNEMNYAEGVKEDGSF